MCWYNLEAPVLKKHCKSPTAWLPTGARTQNRAFPKTCTTWPYHQWSDTNIPGVFSLFEPVLRWMAKRAVRKGIDRELEAQYCRF
ncbi:MAG: hypothetical protein IPM36_19560 [Lewinellaceae bacterium]|nr:hypothetical protein [Lewinellaceae bacterium]